MRFLKINKSIVQKRFKKNLYTYDKYAIIQKKMAKNLLNYLILKTNKSNFDNILELGCGTGLLTTNIKDRLLYKYLYLNDIIEDLKDFFPNFEKTNFFHGDIENCYLPNNNDLIISNATFQWLDNIEAFLIKIKEKLKRESFLAFTTFGEENLIEFKKIENLSLKYYQSNQYLEFLKNDFKIIYFKEEINKLYLDSPVDILKSLKYTGVTGIKNSFWTRKDLNKFTNNYNRLYRKDNKVSLTYHPIYIIAQRRKI